MRLSQIRVRPSKGLPLAAAVGVLGLEALVKLSDLVLQLPLPLLRVRPGVVFSTVT